MAARGAPCVGVLLAGGSASRFGGRPKGLALLEGDRIADRVLNALAHVTDRLVIAANDPRATAWFPAHQVVADAVPGLGPLAGLATALRAGGGAAVLVVAWDMPLVTAALLAALRERGERTGVSVVPVHGAPSTLEPLCAYYRAEAGQAADTLLGAGERRARALHDALSPLQATELDMSSMPGLGDPARLFTSVDTVEGLERLGGTLPGDWDEGPTRR